MPSDERSTDRVFSVHDDILGHRVRVYDTLDDFLLVRAALQDELLDGEDRFWILVEMIYPDPEAVYEAIGDDLPAFLSETLYQCFGIDIDGTRPHDDRRALDWDEDRQRIIVTGRTAYSMGWDDLRRIPYTEACALMMLAPHETPMGQAVYYRLGKPPKETKYNKEQVKAWRDARKHYRLQSTEKNSIERQMAAEAAQFDALARRAKAAQRG